MIETENLQRLDALAGAIHSKGTTIEMLNRWAAFEAACKPELIQAMVAELGRLKIDNDALRKDAERYRWLRDPDGQEDLGSEYNMPPIICGFAEHEDILANDALDKAIDTGMEEKQP